MKSEVAAFARSAGGYLLARAELFALEGSEAAALIRERLVKTIIAGAFIGIAYLTMLIAGIAIGGAFLATQADGLLANWTGVALATGILHLLIGLIFLKKSRKKNAPAFFEYSRAEWEKDQQWIQQQNRTEN